MAKRTPGSPADRSEGAFDRIFRRVFAAKEADRAVAVDELNARAGKLKSQSRYDEAEALYRQSLARMEATYGPDHPSLVFALNNLGEVLTATSRYDEAEALFRRSLAISEAFDPDHQNVAVALHNLATLLKSRSRYKEAEALERRSLTILEDACGPDDPIVARALASLAGVLADQRRYDEAEPLYRRSLAIKEASFGPDHLEVASTMLHFSALLMLQNRFDETVPLLQRSLEIKKTAYGPDHPEVVHVTNLLGGTLDFLGRTNEATALSPKAPQPGLLRREAGKKYLDIDGAHAVVHASSTVEGYLDRCAGAGSVIFGDLDREVDELAWFQDGTFDRADAQECCYCGMPFQLRLRFPNTSGEVECSHCGRGQEFYVVQMSAGFENALGMKNQLGPGYSTIWLTVPLRHPEFSTLLSKHGMMTWKSPHRLDRPLSEDMVGRDPTEIGAQFQNTWQNILWFGSSKSTLWWPRYQEKFGDVELLTEL